MPSSLLLRDVGAFWLNLQSHYDLEIMENRLVVAWNGK
jgi:plasmid maintenance system antidote protein VapI